MADEAVTFDFSAVVKRHRELAAAAGDLTPTMTLLAQKLMGDVHATWDSAGGGTWPPLAPSTIARKGSEGALRMLFETGEAYGSLVPLAGSDFAGAEGTSDHLRWHVGDQPRTKIPKRDPFDIPDQALGEAAQMVLEAILGGKK